MSFIFGVIITFGGSDGIRGTYVKEDVLLNKRYGRLAIMKQSQGFLKK